MNNATRARHAAWKRRRQGRRGAWPGIAAEPLPVTFPATQLQALVRLALGADLTASWLTWNWLDITDRVAFDQGIDIEAGRRNEGTKAGPSTCQLRILNDDGELSRLNPMSTYFGLLTRNNPIWVQIDPGSGYITRYQGFVNELPISWPDESGEHAHLLVECSGVLRRIGQGSVIENPLNRTILGDNPVHYWRVDDPPTAGEAASSLPNGGPALVATGVGFAELDSPPGGDGGVSAANLVDGELTVNGLAVEPPYTVEFCVKRPEDGSLDAGTYFVLRYYENGVLTTFDTFFPSPAPGDTRAYHHFVAQARQNGADLEVWVSQNGTEPGLVYSATATLGNLHGISAADFTPAPVTDFAVAYIAVYEGFDAIDAEVHSNAVQAFTGEQAHARMARLSAEAGIPFSTQAAESEPMGAQTPGNLLDLLRQCETTDQGVLWEDGFGLRYQALSERYNQPVALELDFDAGHVFGTPLAADDDQRLRNQWTIRSSSTGSERTANNTDSIAVDGLRDDSDIINSGGDDQLADHAGWRVRVGTADEYRWATLAVNLGGTPDLIPGWVAAQLGTRTTAANPPTQAGPDTPDVILEGYRERIDTESWVAHLNTAPASPYIVGIAGESATSGSWAQTSDAVLAADIDTTQTSITVTSADDWTNAAPGAEHLKVRGEVIALDAVSGTAPNWTLTVTRSVNGVVKSHPAGAPIRVRYPLVAVL